MSEADSSARPDTELSGHETNASYHAGSDTDTDKLHSSSSGDETANPSNRASSDIGTGKPPTFMQPGVETTNANDGTDFSTDTDKLPLSPFPDRTINQSNLASSHTSAGKPPAVPHPIDKTTNASVGADHNTSAGGRSTFTRSGLFVEPGRSSGLSGRPRFNTEFEQTADLYDFPGPSGGYGAAMLPTEGKTRSIITHLERPLRFRTWSPGNRWELSQSGKGSVVVTSTGRRSTRDQRGPWLSPAQVGGNSICLANFEITPDAESGKSLFDPDLDEK